MAAAGNHRMRTGIVLATLGSCAFFAAQAATTLLSNRVLAPDANVTPAPRRGAGVRPRAQERHDPKVILRRNIFDSGLGDLSLESSDDLALPEMDMPGQAVEEPCQSKMRLIGTVVLPGQLEQSLAAIVGSDDKAGLHRGGTEVEGARIRSIQSDSVVLQTSKGFCRLAMFEVEGAEKKPILPPPRAAATNRRNQQRSLVDRNAGLSDEEIAEGIEKVNDTNYNISRTMMSKVLDNAGRLIGIAAVAPKMEGGSAVGMEIRGIRPDTLLTKLGLQNGDVLESVNGQSLTSTDAALGAYTTLRTADKFNLAIRRGEQSIVINYNLQ